MILWRPEEWLPASKWSQALEGRTEKMETEDRKTDVDGRQGAAGGNVEPGEFPLDALSPIMRDIAAAVADTYQVPVSMPAMAALAIHAGAIGKTYRVINAVPGHQSHGNLYVLIAAERGCGKSTVAMRLARPLIDAKAELAKRFLLEKIERETKAAVLQKQIDGLLRKAMKSVDDSVSLTLQIEGKKRELAEVAPHGLPIPMPSLIEGDTTSEALTATLTAGDQALVIYSPDGGDVVRVALGKYNKGQQGDFDLLLKGWSSESFFRNRVSSGRSDLVPTLSVLLFVQPFILRELMGNEEAFERGLTARPLIFDPKLELLPDNGIERAVPDDITVAWDGYIRFLTKERPTAPSFEVECSAEAREAFRQFHNESIQLLCTTCAEVSGELSRWRENSVRIALNLYLADRTGGEITGVQAERAVRIMWWCGRSYLAILNQGRGTKKYARVQRLRAVLIDTPNRTITLRDFANRHNYDQGEVRALATEFPDLLKVEIRPSGGQGGRPSEVLTLAGSL